jgi:Mitochondrial domain of unknown function (DUF1713)
VDQAVTTSCRSRYARGLRDRPAFTWSFNFGRVPSLPFRVSVMACPSAVVPKKGGPMGSVIKKRRKRMAKKKHRKLLKKTRIQRRNKK